MPVATDPKAALTARVHKLQEALDHAHAIGAVLDDDEHQIRSYLSDLRASLTVARDATSDRLKVYEANECGDTSLLTGARCDLEREHDGAHRGPGPAHQRWIW